MPDLDNELTALGEQLGESVAQPELQSIVARSRARTFRRRRQIGAAVAVLLVGAAIPVFRTALRPVPEPDLPPAAAETIAEQPPPVTRLEPNQPFVFDADFADDTNGFALRGSCVVNTAAECTTTLLATLDRGDTWKPIPLPSPLANPSSLSAQLFVFDAKHIAVSTTGAAGEQPRWFSGDGGHTWGQVPAKAGQTVAAIPVGAILRWVCVPDEAGCVPGVEALLPDSGRSATLGTPIPLTGPSPASGQLVDGAWWVSGHDPNTGEWALAVSRDAGRSWSRITLPHTPTTPFWDFSVVAGDHALYAAATGQLPEVKTGLLAIFRSADGGRTWQQIWQADGGKEPRSINGVPIATPDGELIVVTERGAAYGVGSGSAPAAASRCAVYPQRTRAGYLCRSASVPTDLVLSANGTQWKDLHVVG